MKKIIESSKAFSKKNGGTCEVLEYLFCQPNLGLARAKINGRYPAEQNTRVINKTCDLIYFVIKGTGIIHTPEGDFTINVDDAVYLSRQEWYWVEGKNLEVIVVSAPAWTADQYVEVGFD